jgi:hypothetical protein
MSDSLIIIWFVLVIIAFVFFLSNMIVDQKLDKIEDDDVEIYPVKKADNPSPPSPSIPWVPVESVNPNLQTLQNKETKKKAVVGYLGDLETLVGNLENRILTKYKF